MQGGRKLANPPPFTLQDLRNAIPNECFEKDTFRSVGEHKAAHSKNGSAATPGMHPAAPTPTPPHPWQRAHSGSPAPPPGAAHLALDVGVVAALAIAAYHIDNPLVWPLYWFAQVGAGEMPLSWARAGRRACQLSQGPATWACGWIDRCDW